MAMKGFDLEFENVQDYCRKVTHRIWEDRGIDRIRDYYAKNAPVRTPAALTNDVEDVVQSTTETLHTFPDRQLLDEDIISSEDSPGVFYSSHRIMSVMTHKGDSVWGEPTGAVVRNRGAADCVYSGNRVVEEWMIRDQAGLLVQLGKDPKEFAYEQVKSEIASGHPISGMDVLTSRWMGGPVPKSIDGLAESYSTSLEEILTQAKIRNLSEHYDQAATLYGSGSKTYHGHKQMSEFYIGLVASFPQAKFNLCHWVECREPDHPVRIALRWCIEATHSGHGRFGKPSQAPVAILGVTHAEVWGGKVVREFQLIDELSIWKQIAAHQLSSSQSYE